MTRTSVIWTVPDRRNVFRVIGKPLYSHQDALKVVKVKI